jgi:hypothetical protein
VAKVLVLYPLTSIWANYVPQKRDAVGNVIEGDFNWLTDTLLRMHYDFDIVEEDVLAGAEIGKGRIGIREESFEVLILPPVTHIKKSTFEAIWKPGLTGRRGTCGASSGWTPGSCWRGSPTAAAGR